MLFLEFDVVFWDNVIFGGKWLKLLKIKGYEYVIEKVIIMVNKEILCWVKFVLLMFFGKLWNW